MIPFSALKLSSVQIEVIVSDLFHVLDIYYTFSFSKINRETCFVLFFICIRYSFPLRPSILVPNQD